MSERAAVFSRIPFAVDLPALCVAAHVEEGDELYGELTELVGKADACACPKVMLRTAELTRREDGGVASVGGVTMRSLLLDKNFEGLTRVVAYVATCGRELDAIDTGGDPLVGFWLDCIRLQAVRDAAAFAAKTAAEREGWKKSARLNPGSLKEWPITRQRELFEVLGGETSVREAIGVELTDSFLMRPLKSVSGLIYPTENDFENCMLCPREYCIGRRAPFDAALAMEYGEHRCGMN